MTDINKIDVVLDLIVTSPKPLNNATIKSSLLGKNKLWVESKAFESELMRILDKLHDDKYIYFKSMAVAHEYKFIDVDFYILTFEGAIYFEQGGYSGKLKKETISANLQSVQTWAIVAGTIAAAISTTGLLIFEYVKLNHHNPFHLKHNFYILILVSILGTLLTLLSIRNRLKNPRQ